MRNFRNLGRLIPLASTYFDFCERDGDYRLAVFARHRALRFPK